MQFIPSKIQSRLLSEITKSETDSITTTDKQVRKMCRALQGANMFIPLLVDKDGTVIAGHIFYECAKHLKMEHVPVIEAAHLSSAQVIAFRVACKKIEEETGFDRVKLAKELKYLISIDHNLEFTGHTDIEIDTAISILDDEEKDTEEPEQLPLDEFIAETGNTVTILGDKWRLGDHDVICGDSREERIYGLLMGDKKASIIFADPPYNLKIDGNVGGLGKVKHKDFAMATGEMTKEEFITFLKVIFKLQCKFSKDGSIHYQCMDWKHFYEISIAIHSVYTELKNVCMWVKNNAGMGSLYRSQHEAVFVCKNGKGKHVNNVELGKNGRNRSNVWNYAGVNTFRKGRMDELSMHPTVKPTRLVMDALLDTSNRGDIVLDSFGGSGTTLIAAERTGRKARLIEISEGFVDIIIKRWQEETGQQAVHEETGLTYDELAKVRLNEGDAS